jgi:hypothetical protein
LKRYHLLIFISILFAGCSLNENINSSAFSKRKYFSGYFLDLPKVKPCIEAKMVTIKENMSSLSKESKATRIDFKPAKELKETQNHTELTKPAFTKNIKSTREVEPVIKNTEATNNIRSQAELKDQKEAPPENKTLLLIGEILYILAVIMACIWFFTAFSQGVFIVLALILYALSIAALVKSHPKPGSSFLSYGVVGFLISIICASWLFAVPHVNLSDYPLHESSRLVAVETLGVWMLISVFFSIKALIKPGKQYKGFAIAAIIIAIGVLVASFILHYF